MSIEEKYMELDYFWGHEVVPSYFSLDDSAQQRLFFDYTFRILISLYENFSSDDQKRVKLIASEFYNLSFSEISQKTDRMQKELPKFIYEEKNKHYECWGQTVPLNSMIDFLEEIINDYDISNAHTFDEALAFVPQQLGFPPEYAFEILASIGHERNVE